MRGVGVLAMCRRMYAYKWEWVHVCLHMCVHFKASC